jgi:tRNA threonylcarbamoyladenosine biosynthesis protein TsaB
MRKKTLLLSVDTTIPSGSVALLEDGRLRAEINCDSKATYSERLLPSIEYVLREQNKTIRQIDAFAVAAGPGSFTGIRIGVSTVKSLAEASQKPVAPVSSLEALAMKLRRQGGRLLCPLIDAKKGEVYAALFEEKAGGIREVIPQGVYLPAAFFARLPSRRKVSFIGSGVGLCRVQIIEQFKDLAHLSSRSPFIAHEVGLIGGKQIAEGKGIQGTHLKPLYFRRSQAEEGHQ